MRAIIVRVRRVKSSSERSENGCGCSQHGMASSEMSMYNVRASTSAAASSKKRIKAAAKRSSGGAVRNVECSSKKAARAPAFVAGVMRNCSTLTTPSRAHSHAITSLEGDSGKRRVWQAPPSAASSVVDVISLAWPTGTIAQRSSSSQCAPAEPSLTTQRQSAAIRSNQG